MKQLSKNISGKQRGKLVNECSQSYDNDFFGWTTEQANLLKEGDFEKLDIENLREEIEALGRSEKRALKSHLIKLLMHLLKCRYQPYMRTRSWDLTIKNNRMCFKKILEENPSLKPKIDECILDSYKSSRLSAEQETGLDEKTFPKECPFSREEIFDESFFGKGIDNMGTNKTCRWCKEELSGFFITNDKGSIHSMCRISEMHPDKSDQELWALIDARHCCGPSRKGLPWPKPRKRVFDV